MRTYKIGRRNKLFEAILGVWQQAFGTSISPFNEEFLHAFGHRDILQMCVLSVVNTGDFILQSEITLN